MSWGVVLIIKNLQATPLAYLITSIILYTRASYKETHHVILIADRKGSILFVFVLSKTSTIAENDPFVDGTRGHHLQFASKFKTPCRRAFLPRRLARPKLLSKDHT